MKITNIIKVCPGKHHAWYLTDGDFKIRKPIGDYTNNISYKLVLPEITKYGIEFPVVKNKSWFRRLIDWIRRKLCP